MQKLMSDVPVTKVDGLDAAPEKALKKAARWRQEPAPLPELDGGGRVRVLTARFLRLEQIIAASMNPEARGHLFLLSHYATPGGAIQAARGINERRYRSIHRPVPPLGYRWVATAAPTTDPERWSLFVGIRHVDE